MPCGLHTENPRVSERVLDGMLLSLHRPTTLPVGSERGGTAPCKCRVCGQECEL